MSILNKKETRRLILGRLEVIRPVLVNKLTRVSEQALQHLEFAMRREIDRQLELHSTVGKTITFR